MLIVEDIDEPRMVSAYVPLRKNVCQAFGLMQELPLLNESFSFPTHSTLFLFLDNTECAPDSGNLKSVLTEC